MAGDSSAVAATPAASALPATDWGRLAHALPTLNETTVPGVSEQYLRAARTVIPSAAQGLYLFDPRTFVVEHAAVNGVSDYLFAVYEERGRAVDPMLRAVLGTGRPTSSLTLLRPDEWAADPMYEICQLQRFEHKIEAPIVADGQTLGSLHFAFDAEQPTITPGMIELAGVLGFLVGSAVASASRTAALARERDGVVAGLDLARDPLVITDLRDGRRRANRSAQEVLDRLADAEPSFSLDAVLARAEEAERQCGEAVARVDVRLPGGGTGVLRVRSIRAAGVPDLVTTTLSLDEATTPDLPPAISRVLAPREAEVARRIAAGQTNQTIARELCLSPYTVKEYTGRIYRRTGAASRVELARLVWEAAPTGDPAGES